MSRPLCGIASASATTCWRAWPAARSAEARRGNLPYNYVIARQREGRGVSGGGVHVEQEYRSVVGRDGKQFCESPQDQCLEALSGAGPQKSRDPDRLLR